MNINELKDLLRRIDIETENAHEVYANRSTVHRAALEIMQFEKDLHYGDVSSYQYLSKIREIIELHSAGIMDEITKVKS